MIEMVMSCMRNYEKEIRRKYLPVGQGKERNEVTVR